ncbi:hypothetical protein GGF40_001050 [Coemansia sp. RSA 1286]|nr:hypothetical protein GGF39_001096 [Coemansia sp. RSA 1721]KAJ2639188.1 hypothetical protein GGF40_001050 [Coemansia sp. RSA 1286]
MLKLCAAEIKAKSNGRKPIWVDIGGGTGWNIEQMDKYKSISTFEHVYLVDLCKPLCAVAEKRFAEKGWKNVSVICQDASSFKLDGITDHEGPDYRSKVDLITMSYSLSMIELFYPVIDYIAFLLKPDTGVLGVADFYVSEASTLNQSQNQGAGILGYRCNWFTRVFWKNWFSHDHVYLDPCRRQYLEHRFSSIKVVNGRNHFIVPHLIQIPYYIWLGRVAESSFGQAERKNIKSVKLVNTLEHLQCRDDTVFGKSNNIKCWERLAYQPSNPDHAQFSTYIYGFTWEDPQCDIDVLDLRDGDNILAITSAGDNILAYAAHQTGLTLHCVDMNPCQNHLLELKLAALLTLDYRRFWNMFGKGYESGFRDLLDTTLSSHLSSAAYQYWLNNISAFAPKESGFANWIIGDLAKRNFYTTGYSGTALLCLKLVLKFLGVHASTEKLTECDSLEQQSALWISRIRQKLLGNLAVVLLDNPIVMWRLLGVPINQWNMLRQEGSMSQYVRDTLDPVALTTKFSDENYFYHLLIRHRYSHVCCPDYLAKPGFDRLQSLLKDKTSKLILHTSTITGVLQKLNKGELSKAVIMDHMDWFSLEQAEDEAKALARAIRPNGFVLWRSAARNPWYIRIFEAHGFVVEALSIRQPNTMIPNDRVNMYASFYKATRI